MYVILKPKIQHQRCGKCTALQNNSMSEDYAKVFTNIHATSHKLVLQIPSKPDHWTSAKSCLPLHPGQRVVKSSSFTVSYIQMWTHENGTKFGTSIFTIKRSSFSYVCSSMVMKYFIFGLLLLC